MTTRVAEDRQDHRPGADRDGRRGAGPRALLFAATALAAGAAGVAGALLHRWATAPDTSAVDARAAAFAEHLRGDLNAGFHSGGQPHGGKFTEGTLVARAGSHGGVPLSARHRPAGGTHTAEVMLGLVPPDGETVAADAYPVRCYRYTFGRGPHSVEQSDMPCPTSRTDGRPGSLTAQMGALLAQGPTGPSAHRRTATAGYAHTPRGALKFLKEKGLIAPGTKVAGISGQAAGAGVYALSLRIDGACHYLRMDPSPTSDLVPLWPARADEQETRTARQAATAATLYGVDPAKLG
ncbi:hypothetical protein [Streptomyces sp. NK15101]|uniref:hypothetical protein n=1 Tax=Streptomyces sp. NK15101 TaxID=2873261 RepID=UPI001CED42CB|nr:hypothetical protein [Streptomyces sp. NK15101]